MLSWTAFNVLITELRHVCESHKPEND